jgi:hypothetical protein
MPGLTDSHCTWPQAAACAQRDDICARCEKFPYSGQVRPSAAAAGRRAGPVLAPLRAAGPAAAHNKDPMTENGNSQAIGPRAV